MHKGNKIILLALTPTEIVKHEKELAKISNNDHALDPYGATSMESKLKGGAFLAKISLNAENFVDGAPCRTMLCRHISFSHDDNPMSCNLCPSVTNILQEIDGGMESRTTPIQEGEDDEDITKVDTHEPWPSPSYKSSSTWTPRSVRIQQATLDRIGHISLIRHQKEAFFDVLER
jgi:hypothetical protein